MDPGLSQFLNEYGFFIVGGLIAVVIVVITTIAGLVKTCARERSRREIAAYIAEGSMTPEQGERLMVAGNEDD